MSTLFENIEIEEISEVNNHEYDSSSLCFIGSDNNPAISTLCDQVDEEESDVLDNYIENQSLELKTRPTTFHKMDKNLLVMLSNGKLLSLKVFELNSDGSVSTSSESGIISKAKSKKKVSKIEPCIVSDSETEFKCPVSTCGEICSSFTELLNHKRIHKELPIYMCQYCKRKFATNYSLKSHKRTHTGEKPYHCTETSCNKKFNTSGDLLKHNRTHTGERPFQCELCGKSFTTSNIRKVHMRTHTGEKPYHCKHEGCDRKFSSATNYQNHSRIHTGEKPYVCSYAKCQSRFTEYSSLYKHYLVHSGVKKHVCTICKRQYKQLSSLNIHISSVHINEDFKEEKDPLSDEHTYNAKIWNGYSASSEATVDIDVDESPLEEESIRTVGAPNLKIKSLETITKGQESVFVLTSITGGYDPVDTNVLNNDTSCV